jgi:hypothetical protein
MSEFAVAIKVKGYPELMRALDARRRQLGMSMLDVDFKSGLQDGYSAKLFCLDRKFGELSLPLMLQALGVHLLVVFPPPPETAPAPKRQTHMEPRLLALPAPLPEGPSQ